jgi:hypothetical protein
MKRWTNGLPGATKRLGANLALGGLSGSESRMRADTHDGPEHDAPLQRPNTLLQLSRSSILEAILYRAAGPYKVAHPSRGNCREGRPVTARKRTLALSRSLAARARARFAELDQEIERLQRTDEAIVVATGAPREPPPLRSAFGAGARGAGPSTRHGSGRLSSERRSRPRSAPGPGRARWI